MKPIHRLYLSFLFILALASVLQAQPANDECATATTVSALPFTDQVNTRLATVGTNDPVLSCADGGGGKTVWYSFTPGNDVFVTVNTRGSSPNDYDTALAIFLGSCDSLIAILCNDDISLGQIRQSEILFQAQAGVTYIIHVAEWNGGGPNGGVPTGGDLVFNIEETLPPPLFQGPESGSISSGAGISTDGFTTVNLSPTGRSSKRRKAIMHGQVSLSKINKQPLVTPAAPLGANFVADLAANTKRLGGIEAPILLTNFQGIPDRGELIPPDPIMAAGPEYLIGAVNSEFGIFDKSGNLVKLIDGAEWFNNVLPGTFPCDPQVHFDPHSNRWIMIYIECGGQAPALLLSISDDDNPLGNWCNWRLPGDVNGSTFTGLFNDYPKLGVDEQAVYVTANMFDFGFQYVQLRVIPKAQLLGNNCGPVTWTDFWDLRNPSSPGDDIFTLVPALTYGTPGVEYLVDADALQEPGTFMNLWSLTDPTSPSPTLTGVTVPVAAFTTPTDADQLGGGEPRIDVGGRRVRNAVYQNGSIWTAHSVGNANGEFARARYVRIDAATATAIEDVAFGEDDFWYYYPAVTVDANDNLVMVFTRSGITEYASAAYTGRLNSAPPGLQPSAILKAGEDNYVKTFGSGRNRWGDYTGIARDPAEPNSVWMFAEYAAQSVGPFESDDRWGTWFGRTTFNPLPGAQIIVQPTTIDFGKVLAGRSSNAVTVTILNQGDTDLVIDAISDPGPPFILSNLPVLPVTLGTFASATFEVAFAPDTGLVFNATIAISSTDSDDPIVNVVLHGEGRDPAPEGTALFTVNGAAGTISQLDPVTCEVLNTIPTPEPSSAGPDGLAYDGSSLFFVNSFGTNVIYELNPATGEVRNSFPAPTCGLDALAHSGSSLFGSCYATDTIFELDPITGTEINSFTIFNDLVGGLSYGGERGTLFVTEGFVNILEVDAFDGTVLNSFAGPAGSSVLGLGYSDHFKFLFAATSDGKLYTLDPDNGNVVDSCPLPAPSSALAADEYRLLFGPHVALSPLVIDFGKTFLGKISAPRRINLRSVGTDTVTVTGLTDPGSPFELVSPPALPIVLAPLQVASVAVRFEPVNVGPAEATIVISSDDVDDPVQELSVRGEGVIPPPPGTLYGSTGQSGEFIQIDPATGAGTLIGLATGFGSITEIEFRNDGVLFGTTGGGLSNIITIDLFTGAATLAATHAFGAINGLEFDAAGNLLGTHISFPGNPSDLVTVNTATGALTRIGSTGFGNVGGLAFGPDSVLYGVTSSTGGGDLIRIDPATGAGTLIGPTGFSEVSSLEFSPDGVLYGGIGGRDENRGALIKIDPVTGNGTLIGLSGFSVLSGLAFFPGSDVTLTISDTLLAPAGAILEIPVALSLGRDDLRVAALGAALRATNGILSFVDFTAGPIVPGTIFGVHSPAPDSVRIGFADLGGGPITQEGALVTLRFQVAANAPLGATSVLRFSDMSAADAAAKPLSIEGDNGKVTVVRVVSLSGNVQYCSLQGGGDPARPAPDINILLKRGSGVANAARTDSSGNFVLQDIVAERDYRLEARRNDGEGEAVTPADALLAFRAFLGSSTLLGCQSLAADVDANLVIQPVDAYQIFNFYLRVITAFPAELWRAYPANYDIDANANAWKTAPIGIEYPGLNSSQTDQDFHAVLRGDVNLSWPVSSSAAARMVASASAQEGVQFAVSSAKVAPGASTVTWQIRLAGEALQQGLYAFGGELEYEASALEVITARWGESVPAEGYEVGYNILTMPQAGPSKAMPQSPSVMKRLRFGGFSTSAAAVHGSGVLLEVTAKLKTALASGSALPLRLANVSATVGRAASSDDGLSKGGLSFAEAQVHAVDGAVELANVPTAFALAQNYPNPFNPTTQIHYELPEAATVQIVIFNTFGQTVKTLVRQEAKEAGYYDATWNGRDEAGLLATSGVYFYRLEARSASRTFTETKKMALVK